MKVEQSFMSTSKIYFGYSHYELFRVKRGSLKGKWLPKRRATVAIQLVGNAIVYGMSFCSPYDVWDREEGRKKAVERMNKGFGIIDLMAPKCKINESFLAIGEQKTLLNLLSGLLKSLENRNKASKYLQKVIAFNKAFPAESKEALATV